MSGLMRAAIYCRVSTEEQATEGMSISAQKKQLIEYAHRNQMIVVDEFVDEGVSARTAERPQFQRMVSSAKKKPKPFDIILIHKTDRFARNREDAIIYKSLLRRDCEIDVRSITEQFEDSPTGKLLEGMMEVMAEFYSLNLSQEVMKGMKEKASRGKGLGMAPLGYRLSETGKLEIVPEEAAIVRWIFETYTRDREGLLTVANRLHTEGVSRFGPAGAKYKWSSVGIRVIITNPAYTGALVWNRRDGAKKKRFRKPEDWIVVENAHEPIVDKQTFDLAQELLHSRRGVKASAEDYMLRGMAKCMDCGASMGHYKQKWKRKDGTVVLNPQLVCVRYQQSRQCYFNHVPIAEVEKAIFDYLRQVVEGRISPDQLEVTFPHMDSVRKEADEIRRQLDAVGAKFQRQLEAYEAGAIDLEDLKAARDRIERERAGLKTRLAEVEDRLDLSAARHVASLRRKIEEAVTIATDTTASPSLRREALHQVVDHVCYSRRQDHLKITLRLG